MDYESTQSEILAYLEKVQEETIRHDQKTTSSISAFRLEKGSGPYKQWEKQPLCAADGDAASFSGDDEDPEKPFNVQQRVSRRYFQVLILANCAFIALIIIVGIMLGFHGRFHGGHGHLNNQGSEAWGGHAHNLHLHHSFLLVPAPAPSQGRSSGHLWPVAVPVPAPNADAGATAPGTTDIKKGAVLQSPHQHNPFVSANAMAAAAYWRKQKSETAATTAAEEHFTTSAPVPAPTLSVLWHANAHMHGAPSPQPMMAPVSLLPPARLPSAKNVPVPAWAHKIKSAKQGKFQFTGRSPGLSDLPTSEPSAMDRWSPFHAVREHQHPLDSSKMTYLTPDEVSALGNNLRDADTSQLPEEDSLDYMHFYNP